MFLLFFLTAGKICIAQYPVVKASIDKNEILIGEQIKLSVEAKLAQGNFQASLPVLPDSMEHFEIVNKTKADSVYSNGQLSAIRQVFTITSFDSGKWVIPPVKMNFKPAGNGAPLSFYTDSFPVSVSFSLSDTTSQLKDIKPIREAEKVSYFWYWVAAGILLLILIGLLIWFYRNWKKNKSTSSVFEARLSPFEEAMQELNNLKKINTTSPEEIKLYHTKLSDILKRYLSRKDKIMHLNKTTGDILMLLSGRDLDKTIISDAASALRCGDAVKFAKYIPSADENEQSLQSIKKVISVTEEDSLTNKR